MIQFVNVSKTYPNGVKALSDISITIEPGEFVAVIGLSGAGKSTFLRLINQLIDNTAGDVIFDGITVNKVHGRVLRNIRRQIGMIFQGFNIVKRMSVLNNVLSGRVAYHPTWRTVLGLFPEEDKQIAYRALQRVDILEKVHTRASELSGGQQQRVVGIRAGRLLRRMFLEPDWAFTPRIYNPMIETIRMAIVGTFWGAVFALPTAVLAAENFLHGFEVNVRAAAVLGYVGAGGIGQTFEQALAFRRFGRVGVIIMISFFVVLAIDLVSSSVRKRLV